MQLPPLSLVETRVLGVLVEKQKTVPDSYPLSLNALVAGCAQKTSRDPVIDVAEADVQAAVDRLRQLSLVVESSGGRVMRYAHNIGRVLAIPTESVALLATLLLRGPQTPAEIRANCERLHRFADTSSVENYLRELAERPPGALVAELPRGAGSREARWTHVLSGPLVAAAHEATFADSAPTPSGLTLDSLARDVESLRQDIAELRQALERLGNDVRNRD